MSRSRMPAVLAFAVALSAVASAGMTAAAETDTGGTAITGVPAGALPRPATPTVAVNPINQVLSYDNQAPMVSGTITELAPGAAAAVPYAGQPLVLSDSALGQVRLTTNASGGFGYTFRHPLAGETFSVQVPGSTAVTAARSRGTTFSARADRVAISAKLSATSVSYGGRVTVTGTVSHERGSKFVPLPGQPVRIYDRAGAASPVATAVTNARGRFAAALPEEAASVHWVLRAGGGRYLSTATSTLPMKVSLPTAVSGFHAALNPYRQVSFRGCAALAAGVPGAIPSPASLAIQYSAGPGGPWQELGTVTARAGTPCGHGGRTFSGTLTARLNSAYYRAAYPGATGPAGTGYLHSASGSALAWKYLDRITSFSVSNRTVPKSGELTVTGRLQYYFAGTWRNHGSQQVLVILRPEGAGSWYWIARPTTNSSGQFSATFTDPVSAGWSAEYLGGSSDLATVAGTSYVRVG